MNDMTALSARMAAARRVGSVYLGTAALSGTPTDVVDAAASAAGCSPLGPGWAAIDRAKAQALIRTLLSFDLAYHGRCMPDGDAANFTEEFLRLVPGASQFFANVSMVDWAAIVDGAPLQNYASNPVTEATFSVAVGVVGPGGAAVVAVDDED